MKFFYKALVIFLVVGICAFSIGCNLSEKREADEQAQKAQEEEIIELKIYDVLNKTQVNSMFAPTIGNMVVAVFHNFDLTWEEYKTNTQYKVIISGNYSPNPDLPNLSMDASITYLVDIESGRCEVLYDRNNLTGTFLVYILN